MTKIYSYVLRVDNGSAPNPFWGVCTLAICKPAIRRTAQLGDWVIGTGSKNTQLKDGEIVNFSDCIVYAMKITDKQLMSDYDKFCQQRLQSKIPDWRTLDWRLRMGDCIYDYSRGGKPAIRKGVHNEINRDRDLGGENTLLSTHFYYFGEKAILLPTSLLPIIKRSQGHRVVEQVDIVMEFENWIQQFELNKIYGTPQLHWKFEIASSEDDIISNCSSCHLEDDEDESEDSLC